MLHTNFKCSKEQDLKFFKNINNFQQFRKLGEKNINDPDQKISWNFCCQKNSMQMLEVQIYSYFIKYLYNSILLLNLNDWNWYLFGNFYIHIPSYIYGRLYIWTKLSVKQGGGKWIRQIPLPHSICVKNKVFYWRMGRGGGVMNHWMMTEF